MIYLGVKGGTGSERKDRLTYVRYENHSSARSRKTTDQKSNKALT